MLLSESLTASRTERLSGRHAAHANSYLSCRALTAAIRLRRRGGIPEWPLRYAWTPFRQRNEVDSLKRFETLAGRETVLRLLPTLPSSRALCSSDVLSRPCVRGYLADVVAVGSDKNDTGAMGNAAVVSNESATSASFTCKDL